MLLETQSLLSQACKQSALCGLQLTLDVALASPGPCIAVAISLACAADNRGECVHSELSMSCHWQSWQPSQLQLTSYACMLVSRAALSAKASCQCITWQSVW